MLGENLFSRTCTVYFKVSKLQGEIVHVKCIHMCVLYRPFQNLFQAKPIPHNRTIKNRNPNTFDI